MLSFNLVFAQSNSLDYYINQAIISSPVLVDLQNQNESLMLDSMLVYAGIKPQANFSSSNYYAPVIGGVGYDAIITNVGSFNALAGVTYDVFGKSAAKNSLQGYSIQQKLNDVNFKLTVRDLKQTVTEQYLTVWSEQQQLKNSATQLTILSNEMNALKTLTQGGVFNEADYLSFVVNLNQEQLNYQQEKISVKKELYVLNYLCGIADTIYASLADPVITLSPVKTTSLEGENFFLDSLQLQNKMDQIKFDYKPKLTVQADAGYNTTFQYHAEKNFGESFGLNFSVPLFKGNQYNLQLQQISLDEKSRVEYKKQFNNKLAIQKMQLQQQIADNNQLSAATQNQLQMLQTLLASNNQLLQSGDIGIADYFLTYTNFQNCKAALLQLQANKLLLISQLNFLNY